MHAPDLLRPDAPLRDELTDARRTDAALPRDIGDGLQLLLDHEKKSIDAARDLHRSISVATSAAKTIEGPFP
ncbi:hypothetical protein MT356_12180 [Rathayibacter festucae]|uniref:hypothetical protein n=1 Tax=Rathayibacter festucae TaxID=110937 RepID=UPI001FB25F4C|nr:hypothetical protein [Rathayibacter festucae]MCJ1700476.1 hypothetical protein [Rathayibacter festucae]